MWRARAILVCDICAKTFETEDMMRGFVDEMIATNHMPEGWSTKFSFAEGILHICPDCNKKMEDNKE